MLHYLPAHVVVLSNVPTEESLGGVDCGGIGEVNGISVCIIIDY